MAPTADVRGQQIAMSRGTVTNPQPITLGQAVTIQGGQPITLGNATVTIPANASASELINQELRRKMISQELRRRDEQVRIKAAEAAAKANQK